MKYRIPELLSPAGNLEKLKIAVLYGADAVYLGGQKFGLRHAAENFTDHEIVAGVKFAHQFDVKVYVVLNGFLHDEELDQLLPFVGFLEQIGVDAVILSDFGVLETVLNCSAIPIHLSTQASCINVESAKFWKRNGIKRIVLGREVSIEMAREIKEKVEIEVEMFVHGSMCISYSGNCVISNYTSGRDSNRGGCAQSCRFEYSLETDPVQNCYFMSSKDLSGINEIEQFAKFGIDSLKIEGRMKGHLYVGTTTKVYRQSLDLIESRTSDFQNLKAELEKVVHRDYCSGNLLKPAKAIDSVYSERENEESDYQICGFVLEVKQDKYIVLEVRANFFKGDFLELIPFKGNPVNFRADRITDILGNEYQKTRPGTVVKLPFVAGASKWNIVRVGNDNR